MPLKTPNRRRQGTGGTSLLAHSMVVAPHRPPPRDGSLPPPAPLSIDPSDPAWQDQPPETAITNFCVAYRLSQQHAKVSKKVIMHNLTLFHPSTQAAYSCTIKKFSTYCQSKRVDYLNPPVQIISNFFLDFFYAFNYRGVTM